MNREIYQNKPQLSDPGINKNVVGAIKVGDFRLDDQDSLRCLTEGYIKHLDVGFYLLRHKNNAVVELWIHVEFIDVDELIRSNGEVVRLKQIDEEIERVIIKRRVKKEIDFYTCLKDVITLMKLPIGMFTSIGQLCESKVYAVWGDLDFKHRNNSKYPFILVSFDYSSEKPYEVRSAGLNPENISEAFSTFNQLVDHLAIYNGETVENARIKWANLEQSIEEIN